MLLQHERKIKIFQAMQKEAKNHLQAYHDDLNVHDFNFIKKLGDVKFIWVLRHYGTHMYVLPFDSYCRESMSYHMACEEMYKYYVADIATGLFKRIYNPAKNLKKYI